MTDFLFVGYLVQEPYLQNWPRREGYKVATIERDVHLEFKREWKEVDGVLNDTEFHIRLPQTVEVGATLNGYSVERGAIEAVSWSKVTKNGGTQPVKTFEYALRTNRPDDGLTLLGYEVVDCCIERLSVLNNCGYTVDQVREMAGPLNEYSLLSSLADAERFKEAIKTDPRNPKIIPDHGRGVIFEVWGRP